MIRLATNLTKTVNAFSRKSTTASQKYSKSIIGFCGEHNSRSLYSSSVLHKASVSPLHVVSTPISISCPGINDEKSPPLVVQAEEDPGQKYYQLAKEHISNHERKQVQKEEMKQNEQYRNPTQDGTGSGIQVIKTIVKQNRRESSQRRRNEIMNNGQERSGGEMTVGSESESTNDLEKAQEYMQLSAFVHSHNDAIVSLANHALSKSSEFEPTNEFKYVIGKQTVFDGDVFNSIRNCVNGAQVAMILYRLAGENGSKEGWFNLGHLLWTGHEHAQKDASLDSVSNGGIETNIPLALECFEKAVQLNDDDARYFLAVHYIGGGVSVSTITKDVMDEYAENEKEECRIRGLKLVQEAGDNGHAGALYYLALLYRNGDSTLDVEPCMRLFREYLDEAAEGGDADALFMRAYCQIHGEDGYDVNMCAALDGFIMAGDAGNADGYVSAGAMLHRGIGNDTQVKQDQRRAFELYQQAGEMGSLDGWRNVVACYIAGEGVPKCEKTAKYITKTMLSKEPAVDNN